MDIYKESLRRQYGSNRIVKRTVWVGLYYLLKIDENFVKRRYGSNRIVFYYFFAVPRFQKTRKIARFKGRYGSSADDTVHGVQMGNSVHKDNAGWNNMWHLDLRQGTQKKCSPEFLILSALKLSSRGLMVLINIKTYRLTWDFTEGTNFKTFLKENYVYSSYGVCRHS